MMMLSRRLVLIFTWLFTWFVTSTLSVTWMWRDGAKSADSYGTDISEIPAHSLAFPGSRSGMASSLALANGTTTVTVFGGLGRLLQGGTGRLNDLWQFKEENDEHEWTWVRVGGAAVINSPGVYSALGAPASINWPGGRSGHAMWAANDSFYVFGGRGYGRQGTSLEFLNDLWQFKDGLWTWLGGHDTPGSANSYGSR
jgi:hypothetical protein